LKPNCFGQRYAHFEHSLLKGNNAERSTKYSNTTHQETSNQGLLLNQQKTQEQGFQPISTGIFQKELDTCLETDSRRVRKIHQP
jgi:hypothetical protein